MRCRRTSTRCRDRTPLPDPLTFLDGQKVTTAAQWPARREEISKLSQKYVWGKFPPKPKIDHAVVLDETA